MLLPSLLLAALATAPAAPRTFRVDYFHTGTATEERFSLDRLVLEPLPWPGSPARAVDDTNLGKYRFQVRERATQRLLYSRGFSSIYAEWETTGEARRLARTFSESLRFPAPSAPVLVVLEKRDAQGDFHEVWSLPVDPQGMTVDTARPADPGLLLALQKSGPSEDKVDLLLLGDGYTAAERGRFEQDARRLLEVLFSYSPFKERRSDFNVWGLVPAAEESGVSRPSTGVHRRSRIGATYDAFGSERYVLTFENRSLRDVASFAPYEVMEILVNGQTYGGGGIYGLYSTVAASSRWAPYVFVHEFGHHFAALADEYYTSESVYGPATEKVEPWERNVTAMNEPAQLKWKALVKQGTPLPTPWGKERYDAHAADIQKRRKAIRAANRPEAEMDALFEAQKRDETAQFGKEKYARAVGAFEGAMYESRGYYRPQLDCVMFSRNDVPFCDVCQQAIDEVISLYAGPRQAPVGKADAR